MTRFISRSPAETLQWGEELGRRVQRGTVIGLKGELGAGKTEFVKGLAAGLGSHARVHSPTFAIVNLYEDGRLPLAHLDLYRLETTEQLLAAGVEEYLLPKGVAVIEWAERLDECGMQTAAFAGQGAERGVWRQVTLEVVDENTRRITYEDTGA